MLKEEFPDFLSNTSYHFKKIYMENLYDILSIHLRRVLKIERPVGEIFNKGGSFRITI